MTLIFGSEISVMTMRKGRTLGGFQKQCGLTYGGNATEVVHGGAMLIPASGQINVGCGYIGGGYICPAIS